MCRQPCEGKEGGEKEWVVGVLGGHVCGTQWGKGEQEEGNLAGRQEEQWWTGKMSRGRPERGAEAT